MSKRLTARFGRQRRSIFFAFRIVFCSRAVPEDILRDHPCDLNHADDDCSQKVQCGKNNIQQIHNGFLLWVSCMFTFVPSGGSQKIEHPRTSGCREELDHLHMQRSAFLNYRVTQLGRNIRKNNVSGRQAGSFSSDTNRAIPSPALLPGGNRVPPQRTVLRETPGLLTLRMVQT